MKGEMGRQTPAGSIGKQNSGKFLHQNPDYARIIVGFLWTGGLRGG